MVQRLHARLACERERARRGGRRRRPGRFSTASSYGAIVFTTASLQGVFVATAVLMARYTVARSLRRRLSAARRATFDNTVLFWHYTVAQGLLARALLHLVPRLLR